MDPSNLALLEHSKISYLRARCNLYDKVTFQGLKSEMEFIVILNFDMHMIFVLISHIWIQSEVLYFNLDVQTNWSTGQHKTWRQAE